MLTVSQIAERLNISVAIVYGWIKSGVLAHFRLGGKGRRGAIRVAEADLDAFLENQKQGGRQPELPPVPRPQTIKLRNLAMD